MRVTVADFSPKLGLRFANAFPHEPVREVDLPPPFGTIKIGDAAQGLCGGMCFTVADLFATGSPPPEDPDPPDAGSERFDYLVDRQVDSLNRGWLPLRFYSLMSPLRPRREGPIPGIDDSRTYVMVHDEWPAIRAELDKGHLAMIGLVKVVSSDPRQLNHNHQVIGYGYDLDGTTLKLLILDPNVPRSEIELAIDISDDHGETAVTYATSDGTFKNESVVCFFHYPYTAREPVPWIYTRRDDD
jgi:hypothetical protein